MTITSILRRRAKLFSNDSDIMRFLYGYYAKSRIRMDAARYDRQFDAPSRPLHLLDVNPNRIRLMWDTHPEAINEQGRSQADVSQAGYYIWEGNWDQSGFDFHGYDLHEGFQRHFQEGVSWWETEFAQRRLEKIETNGSWKGCSSKEELAERLHRLDRLYESIKKDGYTRIEEIQRENDPIGDRKYYPPELYEVVVVIGRDGQFLFFDGRHRLSIAKLLEVKSIPVRVLARHIEWQQYRDDVVNGQASAENTHPDLVPLL